MSKPFQGYNTVTNTYIVSQNIPREKFLNGFTATNTGDTALRINGVLLGPVVAPAIIGDSITVGGNEGEIFKDRITLVFNLPLGAAPSCEITQKFYITKKDYE